MNVFSIVPPVLKFLSLVFMNAAPLPGLNLPEKVEYKVTYTTDAVKGNTSTNALKDATLENGLEVKVPLFICEGDVVVISTKDGKYVSRK